MKPLISCILTASCNDQVLARFVADVGNQTYRSSLPFTVGYSEDAAGPLRCYVRPGDRLHPEFLDRMYMTLKRTGAAACCLTERFYHFPVERSLYWVDFSQGGLHGCGDMNPETMLTTHCPGEEALDDFERFAAVARRGPILPVNDHGYLSLKTCRRDACGTFEKGRTHVSQRAFVAEELRECRGFIREKLAGYDGLPMMIVRARDDAVVTVYEPEKKAGSETKTRKVVQ